MERVRDEVRLRFPGALRVYQRHIRPRLGGDTRHLELSHWAEQGPDILARLGTRAITFEPDGIWVQDPEGAWWQYTPYVFGSALWAEFGEIYEREELDLLAGLLPAGGTMVDIGANIGLHTIKLSQRVEGLHVFAFEPVSATIAALRRNAARNGVGERLHTEQVAISDHEGEIRLTTGFQMGNFVVEDGAAAAQETTETVPMRPLDAVLPGLTDRVDLIKCDVEGHERSVLLGARETLDRHRPRVFIEIMEQRTQRYGYRPTEIFDILHAHGYEHQGVVDGMLTPPQATRAADLRRTTNFLFTHPDAPARA